MLSKNSLLFSFKLSIGRVGFTKFDNMVTNEAIMGFDYKTNKNVNLKYFYYILPIYSILNAGRNAFGSPLMNQKTLNNSKLILTKNILEQTLIATLLTKSDNLIEKEEQNLKKEEKRFKFFQQELLSGRIRTR
jgi:restriction endonuclease S subunit